MSTDTGRGRGLKVATIGGVPVHIGASWLLLAAVLILISGSTFAPLGALAYALGAGYAVSLLVAVLLHEGAHAWMARRLGLPVHRVVADLWGGHTAFDGRGMTPGRAALIAVVGPLTNLVLGLVGLALAVPLDGIAGLLARGLGYVNVLLAVFNLLPGLPLDGGQLVDSLVWRITGRRSSGLVAAGWCGRIVTVLAVLWFVGLPFLAGGRPSMVTVVWTVVIAAFMWNGATRAIHGGHARRLLGSSTLRPLIRPAREWPAGTPAVTALSGGAIPLVRGLDGHLAVAGLPEGQTLDSLGRAPVEAVATRLPAEVVLAASPDDDLTDVVIAMQSTRWGLAVLTTPEHAAYGIVTADDVNAVLARAN